MDWHALVDGLERNAERLRALAAGVPAEQARWRPQPDAWSMVEVACHLLDEEREDFRVRLEYTLNRPGEPWPRIDPGGWVTSRRYAEQDLDATVEAFLQERRASLAWLRGPGEPPDWEATHAVPWGTITAGDLLASWAAHDLLHARQLVELHYALARAAAGAYRADYAGEW